MRKKSDTSGAEMKRGARVKRQKLTGMTSSPCSARNSSVSAGGAHTARLPGAAPMALDTEWRGEG